MNKPWFFLGLCSILACNSPSDKIEVIHPESDSGIYYSYSPLYSNGFKEGDHRNLKVVTDIWKEYENGDVTSKTNDFADQVRIAFPDHELSGKKDSVLGEWKKIREKYSAVQNFIYSWMPAKAKDHDDNWVFIWGKQFATDKKGNLKVNDLHEIWQFDQNGKIILMQQFQSISLNQNPNK